MGRRETMMPANKSNRWEPVETFGTTGDGSEPLDLVDAAVRAAGADGRRFRSGSGVRAILVPVEHLAGGPLSSAGLSSAVTHVLFVDPVPTGVAPDLLGVIGLPAASVRVAVPGTAAPAGLTADAGRIDVDSGPAPAISFVLYRVADGPKIAPGPRIGESSDVTGDRSRWFGARHSGPDG
jgi:hypothetical protein